jgi:hypothetical protein
LPRSHGAAARSPYDLAAFAFAQTFALGSLVAYVAWFIIDGFELHITRVANNYYPEWVGQYATLIVVPLAGLLSVFVRYFFGDRSSD